MCVRWLTRRVLVDRADNAVERPRDPVLFASPRRFLHHVPSPLAFFVPVFLSRVSLAQRLEAAKRKQDRASSNTDKNEGNGDGDGGDDAMYDEDSELDEDEIEARKAAEYFEDGDAGPGPGADEASRAGGAAGGGAPADGGGVPFQQLNISRPLLRAVEAMGYVTPTPVQQRAVPFALAGRYGA